MRRLFASLSALIFLGSMVGCNHTCGLCDCDSCTHSCCCSCAGMGYQSACGAYYMPPAATVAPSPMPPIAGEQLKTPPKEVKPEDKDKTPPKETKPEEKPKETKEEISVPTLPNP